MSVLNTEWIKSYITNNIISHNSNHDELIMDPSAGGFETASAFGSGGAGGQGANGCVIIIEHT